MENIMNGIRDTFYRDLASDYQEGKEKSFLYQYFWQESARELLKKVPTRPSMEGPLTPKDVRAALCGAMRENPEWARSLLLREPPGEGKKERRDFWQELMLNDAGYQAGLTTDTDYYLWLTAYLASRDIYYKDGCPWSTDGTKWLRRLLRAGLGGTDRGDTTKAQTERDLKELARLLRQEQAAGTTEITGRLHNLKGRVNQNGQTRQVEYLPWLTRRLKWAALHNRIKTWLQDNGYPLRMRDSTETMSKEPRKRDFSMQLFDAYCRSPAGYDFVPRGLSGWHMSGEGFCVLDAEQLDALMSALKKREEQSDTVYLYLPLAVHVVSGCVFFLAGKSIYKDVYEQHAAKSVRDAYNSGNALFCFDYFRLNSAFWDADNGSDVGPFQLRPTFHENAEKSYTAVLNDFKRHCVVDAGNALDEVRWLNEDAPSGTPDTFLWAFNPPEELEPSQSGRAAFNRARNNAQKNPGARMV